MKKPFTLQASEAIQKQIGFIGRSAVKMIAAVQLCAAQVIAHAFKHGDITLAQGLVDAVAKHHKATLVAFLEQQGPFKYDKETKKLVHFKRKQVCDADWFEALPMWDAAKPASEPVSIYDMDKEASKFLDRMQKIVDDPSKTVSDKALIKVLIDARNKYVAQKYLDQSNVSPAHVAGTKEAAEQDRLAAAQHGPVVIEKPQAVAA